MSCMENLRESSYLVAGSGSHNEERGIETVNCTFDV